MERGDATGCEEMFLEKYQNGRGCLAIMLILFSRTWQCKLKNGHKYVFVVSLLKVFRFIPLSPPGR